MEFPPAFKINIRVYLFFYCKITNKGGISKRSKQILEEKALHLLIQEKHKEAFLIVLKCF